MVCVFVGGRVSGIESVSVNRSGRMNGSGSERGCDSAIEWAIWTGSERGIVNESGLSCGRAKASTSAAACLLASRGETVRIFLCCELGAVGGWACHGEGGPCGPVASLPD